MATTAGFKQQCPSCEAWVPIRDLNLIGRKIDCPKCKYRFVVEDPGSDAEAEEEAEAPKAATKARRGEGDEARKSVATKAKAGPRRRGEEDDEDDESDARPKSSGGSSKLILGVGIGAVALVVLVVVGLYMSGVIGGDSSASKPNPNLANRPTQSNPSDIAAHVPSESDKTQAAVKPPVAAVPTELLNNLLPPDTEGVCNVRMKELLRTSLGRTIFETPGAFRVEALYKRLGFSMADIEQLIQAWNFTHNWSFNVLRGTKPFNLQAIKLALRVKPAPEGNIEDQEYFLLEPNPWLDNVGRMSFAALLQVNPLQVPARPEPLALRLHDDHTLIIASLTPMKQFLAVKGRFPAKSRPAVVKGPDAGTGEGGTRKKNLAFSGGPAVAISGGSPDGRSPEGSGTGTESQAEALSSAYLTIQPALKSLLDQLEASRPVLDLAVDSQAAQGRVPLLGLNTLNFKTVIAEAGVIGAALVLKGDVLFTVAADCLSEDAAKKRLDDLRKKDGFGQKLAAQLAKLLDARVELDEEGAGPELPGGAAFPSGVARPPAGGGRKGAMAMGGGGAASAEGPAAVGGGTPLRPNAPGQPEEKDDRLRSTVQIILPDKTVVLVAVHLIDKEANSKLMQGTLRQMVLQQKGYLDMAGGGMRVHELAAAARDYADQHQAQFPRGIAYRSTSSARADRPYAPDQCISLLAELLPYLGPEQESLYRQINRQKSWRDPENLPVASTLVPQFLNPQSPFNQWWVQYPGMKEQTAATHYVGIAGIGLDAATYSATDAATAKKLGVFGYERATSVKDITDGASNTILMVQVPPTFRRPWLAGGGSTVVGVPEKDSIKPFVSTQRDGKRGTLAVFADGSVRFIADTVSDDVFKGMCTIKGGEAFIVNRDAPLVPPPEDKVEVVAAQPPSTPNKPSPVIDWKPYTSKEGRFTILLPVPNPTQMKQSVKSPVGEVNLNIVGAELPNNQGSYAVIYHDLPESITQQPGAEQMILDNAAMGAQANVPGAKVVGEPKKITLEDNPGRELTLEAPLVGKMIIRVYLAKGRLYQVLARGSNERLSSKETQLFFDSFKLTGK